MPEITSVISASTTTEFPYDTVLDEFHRVGKHCVSHDILTALDKVRATLPGGSGSPAQIGLLTRFLDIALDKYDDRYDYPTYVALSLLPLPGAENPPPRGASAEGQRDRLVVQLVGDALRFELAVADGRTDLLPQLRPEARTVEKRCRLALRAIRPALGRIGLAADVAGGGDQLDPVTEARGICAAIEADLSPTERRTLRLSMLPVWVVHDEYLFIRVLQSFETTYALIAVQLLAATAALSDGDSAGAIRRLAVAGAALSESAPLFSLLATMQVAAFHTFRAYTEGASAIQSRNYKIVESLCRKPDRPRLDSAAYHSVPEVRARVLAGQATFDEAVEVAVADGRLGADGRAELELAMHGFATALLQWRQTHYSLAVRMLGERSGTGYTEGTPYLREGRKIPVFCAFAPPPEDGR
ncbi:hypothetical protein GCM10009555_076500 [Acrocarpospora macrocephala]|uniref:Tryptophan 2,3-dioxygenase n=1 Tax=Acrocarpospora macrocephala TaxID=150177 RepID=A0A5M3WY41_9ACTN|nr:tryptophan 2,3-dioxygenase [Acrocarpospora macrocephala]GES12819.1 hypothetical protein Amac_064160 [Acrocarpospora macrocephala]